MFDIRLKESDVNRVINELNSMSDFDFVNYSFSFKARRIIDFMLNINLNSPDEFVYRLSKSESLVSDFVKSFFVPQTELFRDAELWNYLQEKVFPKLFLKKDVKIHIPYCIEGEELYSLMFIAGLLQSVNVSVLVSHPFEENEVFIKNRDFGAKELKACQKNIELLKYVQNTEDVFIGHTSKMKINHFFRGQISFEKCDVTEQQHIGEFDMVIFRNRLIYYNEFLSDEVLKKISASLRKGGYLVTGERETLGQFSGKFKHVSSDISVYKKKMF